METAQSGMGEDRETILGEGCAAADEAANQMKRALGLSSADAGMVDQMRSEFRDFVACFYLPLSQEQCWAPDRLLKLVTAMLAIELAAHQALLQSDAIKLSF